MPKMSIKKGDIVEVLSGKDRGAQAPVLRALPESGKVVVEGVAVVKKAVRPTKAGQQGGINKEEAAIDVSNVALVCPSCGKSVRVGHGVNGSGAKIRICKKCNAQF